MHIRIILKLFEKYKCSGISFSLQSSRYVSNEQPHLKTTGTFTFIFCFTFSISYSWLPFHLVYVFQFLHLFFFLTFFLRPLSSVVQKVWYAATAANSLQSCLTLCDPIDGSPPGSPVPGILQTKTLEWVAISLSNA